MGDLFCIRDKVVVITGASRGLGRNFALGMAEYGAKIAAVATKKDLLENVKEEITGKGGVCEIFPTDITSEEAVMALARAVEDTFGRVDVLINNAGVNLRGLLLDMPKEQWDAVIGVNLTGSFLCLKHFGRIMRQRKQGKIINIASVMSEATVPLAGPYCATKGAVRQLTKVAAQELADDNIQVNAIAPGYFATEINAKYLNDPEKSKFITEKVPMKRWGGETELFGTAIYLASNASSFTTGETIYVDGGYLCL